MTRSISAAIRLASTASTRVGGNGRFAGTIYAPYADVVLNRGGRDNYDFTGAMLANSIRLNGRASIHCDEAVPPPPTLRGQEKSISAAAGSSITLDAGAIAEFAEDLRWVFSADDASLVNGVKLTDRTGPALTLQELQEGDAGYYGVLVSNVFGGACAVSWPKISPVFA